MNKILFLYTDFSIKQYLVLFSKTLKTISKRFRKNIPADFLLLDLSPSCLQKTKDAVKNKSIQSSILLCGKRGSICQETALFKETLSVHSSMYFSSGKCIISPLGEKTVSVCDGFLKEEYSTDFSSVEKATKLAISSAKNRKNKILLCTDSANESDRIIYNEFANSMSDARSLDVEHIEFDELICTFAKEIPAFDVVLCPEDKAEIIAMHVAALNSFPIGYSILVGDDIRIHKKETVLSGEFSNLSYGAMLITLADILETDFGLKSAGVHLRKAVIHTLEKCCYEDKEVFQKHLTIEINSPIRKCKVKMNESDN